jgi:DNA-binding response OmpR family regulator/HPt (histidine-containing phosphotransfer) domain-containing protein
VKILFVEDDEHTCELISATLEAHRYAVDRVADGEAGLEMALQWPYDLILLDVILPKLNGIEVCRQLRAKACQIPILVLTARGASEDVIAGLDAGADDYVVKSCQPEQLMARVRALLRRGGDGASTPILTWGDLCLDPSSAQVTFKEATVLCRPKEYTLLELFLRNPQRLLSRSSIIDHLWAYDDAPVKGSVTTLVKDLRRRLKATGVEPDPIETVYGLGYRLKPEPQAKSLPSSVNLSENENASAPSFFSSSNLYGEQRVKDVVQRVDARFRSSWSERLAVLEGAAISAQAGNCNREQQQAALASVHKLVGGLGTFGYDRAAAIAETLEESLMQHIKEEAQWISQFAEMLGELKQELSQDAEFFPGESSVPGLVKLDDRS